MSIKTTGALTNAVGKVNGNGIESKILSKYLDLEDIWRPESGNKGCHVEYVELIRGDRILANTMVKDSGKVYSVINLNDGHTLTEIVSDTGEGAFLKVWGGADYRTGAIHSKR